MTTTQKTTDVTAPRRSHWWWTVPGCLAMVLLNAAVSYGIVRLNAPVTAIASAFNMPLDVLFWCAGSQGSMYPFNGWVSNESSPLQSSLLVSERMAFKLHRQGMIMETIGKNNAVCNEYPSPILPKERWRYQMVNMYPDSGQCHPFGRSVMRWETGKNPPNTKKNFGYLMWRKRNCVFL